jgi:hypothetical protein
MSRDIQYWPVKYRAYPVQPVYGVIDECARLQLARARKILLLYSLKSALSKFRQAPVGAAITRGDSMSPLEKERARDRVHNLRVRLSDTNSLLESVARRIQAQDNDTRDNMRIAMGAIRAVIVDLESVCIDHLDDPLGESIQQAALSRADSEVASGEFDSQG